MTTTSEPIAGPVDRFAKALALVDRDGLGLEVGPSHSPIAPKRQGFNVHVVDYLDADGLREKFIAEGVDVDQIEDVDFVWSGEPLPELVGGRHSYDWVIASHAIEHIPDLVSFLGGCEEILKPGGVVSLIIPDKRYCFDHFQPLSTTGNVLDAYLQHRTRPTPGNVFDFYVNHTLSDNQISWSAEDRGQFAMTYKFDYAQQQLEHARDQDDYLDAHVWRFVPESFRLVVQDLQRLRLTSLKIEREFPSTGNEFYVTLALDGQDQPPADRLVLLKRMYNELSPPPLSNQVSLGPQSSRSTTMEISNRERRALMLKRHFMEMLRGTTVRNRT
jgi:predicted SAM-dependent methyltransferase